MKKGIQCNNLDYEVAKDKWRHLYFRLRIILDGICKWKHTLLDAFLNNQIKASLSWA